MMRRQQLPTPAAMLLLCVLLLCVLLLNVLAGCTGQPPSNAAADADATVPITDTDYLTQSVWDDGQAEVAFYRIERRHDHYGRPRPQSFVAGTYLVKHRFDREAMTKANGNDGVLAFKYALFYEFESGSYQYKRNWVTNLRQHDVRPLKHSFTSFDWCSNRYQEMTFPREGPVSLLQRSDDYGNRTLEASPQAGAYPPHAIPMLVRALHLAEGAQRFHVLTIDGDRVAATATATDTTTVSLPGGKKAAEAIAVRYERPVPSPIGESSDTLETYWRGRGPERHLLKVEAHTGRYQMILVENVRTPYWRENVWDQLKRIAERP